MTPAEFDTEFCRRAAFLSAALEEFVSFHEEQGADDRPESLIAKGLQTAVLELAESTELPGEMNRFNAEAAEALRLYIRKVSLNG